MTYFRYDSNKCGFTMNDSIEWELFGLDDMPQVVKAHYNVESLEGKYFTEIRRGGRCVATLNEQDTARFIIHITGGGRDETGRPRPWIKSAVETIEHFLSAGDRV